jgi:hypothetical protein
MLPGKDKCALLLTVLGSLMTVLALSLAGSVPSGTLLMASASAHVHTPGVSVPIFVRIVLLWPVYVSPVSMFFNSE